MSIIVDNMKWILLVCGMLTFSMIQAVFSPRATMNAYFGETPESEATNLLVRNWGVLVAAGGLLLIYAAFDPAIRPPVLIFVGAGKIAFITLLLTAGNASGSKPAMTAIIVDGIAVALFATYLAAIWLG